MRQGGKEATRSTLTASLSNATPGAAGAQSPRESGRSVGLPPQTQPPREGPKAAESNAAEHQTDTKSDLRRKTGRGRVEKNHYSLKILFC